MELARMGTWARTGNFRSTRRYGFFNLAGPHRFREGGIRMSRQGRLQGHGVCRISGSTDKGYCLGLDFERPAARTRPAGAEDLVLENAATVAPCPAHLPHCASAS